MKDFLTETDKKIALYIEQNNSIVLSSSIHELALLIGVSSSSISKYIKKIGYTSYSRFKVVLAQQNSQPMHNWIVMIRLKRFSPNYFIQSHVLMKWHWNSSTTKRSKQLFNKFILRGEFICLVSVLQEWFVMTYISN